MPEDPLDGETEREKAAIGALRSVELDCDGEPVPGESGRQHQPRNPGGTSRRDVP